MMAGGNGGETWVARTASGTVRVTGRDGVDLLQRLSTQDVARLAAPGRSFSTVFTNEKGRVVDWVFVVAREQDLLLRTSPGRAALVASWIERFTIMEDVRCADETASYVHIVVQGPAAVEAARLDELPPPEAAVATAAGWAARGLAAYGDRVDLIVSAAQGEAVLRAAVAAGARRGADADLELARLLAGVPSPAYEFREEVNPLELRLGAAAVSFEKGCYVGQEVLARIDSYDKLARLLVGFEADAALDTGRELKLSREGRGIGRVTSAAARPGGGTLGLAVVRREAAPPGEATVSTGGGAAIPVRLVDRPFWRT